VLGVALPFFLFVVALVNSVTTRLLVHLRLLRS
jgi:hypothetical protein